MNNKKDNKFVVVKKENSNITYTVNYNTHVIKCYIKGESYVGKARCHENDKFDIAKGQRIALCRLLKKYYNKLYKNEFNNMKAYKNLYNASLNKLDRYSEKYLRYTDELDNLVK